MSRPPDKFDKLIDSAIDVELQRLRAVEPSPNFLARVRTRLAKEPQLAEWQSRWLFLTTGAIAAMIVVVVVLSRSNPTSIDRLPRPAQSLSHTLPSPMPSLAVSERTAMATPPAKLPKPASSRHRPPAATSLDTPAEPEVLVSAAEAQALRRFLDNVREGRVELGTAVLPASIDDFSELADIHPLIPVTIPEGVLQ
jgi:hypothetical protein